MNILIYKYKKMVKYKLKGRYGIDDLKSLYAFHGNSQGDETRTNSIKLYKSSEEWLSFVFDCKLTEEAIFNEIEKKDLNVIMIILLN